MIMDSQEQILLLNEHIDFVEKLKASGALLSSGDLTAFEQSCNRVIESLESNIRANRLYEV